MRGEFPIYVWNRDREEWVRVPDPYLLYACVDWRRTHYQEDRQIGDQVY
jgi:hypothetical protein